MAFRKQWEKIQKDVKRKDKARKAFEKGKTRREQLDEVLVAEKKSIDVAANYVSQLNKSPYLLRTSDGIWWKYSPTLLDRILKVFGLCRKSVLVTSIDFLKQVEQANMRYKGEKTTLTYESIDLVEKMLDVK